VSALGWSVDVGAFESVFHHGRDTVPGGKRPARGDASDKDVIGIDVRRPAFQITEQRIASILREGQPHLVSPFSRYLQRTVVPVDVGETETRHVSGAQS
jgi:hypothetical protein